MERRVSKKIKIGNTYIGGDSDILVQSMLNIPASDIDGSVAQAKELASAGCQVIRFAIPNEDALALIEPIKNAVDVPLVATQFIKTFEKFLQCETDTLLPKKYMLFERLNYVAI